MNEEAIFNSLKYSPSAPWAPPIDRRLMGLYRLQVSEGAVELELVESKTLGRAIVYARSAQESFVLIPLGDYRLYCRQILPDANDATVRLVRMNVWERTTLYVGKIANLLKRGGAGLVLQALRQFFGRRKSAILGATARDGQAADFIIPNRPPIDPVDVSDQLRSVSIIIPTKDRHDLLKSCISSLERVRGIDLEIVIIDNGAKNIDMVSYLKEISSRNNIHVFRYDIPFNFSYLCNEGARLCSGQTLLFLNDDIEALDGAWIQTMLGYLSRDDAGVVGARLLYPSGDLQHAGIASNMVPGPGHPWLGATPGQCETNPLISRSGEVDAVTGACLMIRRDVFHRVGGFDAENFPITINDVDLCLRVRETGLRVFYASESVLVHKEGQTRRADDQPDQRARRTEELRRFFLRHQASAQNSVFYPLGLRRDTAKAIPV